jgi:hypothetical protein
MDAQLQKLIELQTEQNQLLKKHLWRFRFSLSTLLVLTTGICICLGVMIYSLRAVIFLRPAPTATWPIGPTYVPANGAPPTYPVPTIPTNNAPMQPVFPTPANAVPTFAPKSAPAK